jgi:hypothetical protein
MNLPLDSKLSDNQKNMIFPLNLDISDKLKNKVLSYKFDTEETDFDDSSIENSYIEFNSTKSPLLSKSSTIKNIVDGNYSDSDIIKKFNDANVSKKDIIKEFCNYNTFDISKLNKISKLMLSDKKENNFKKNMNEKSTDNIIASPVFIWTK